MNAIEKTKQAVERLSLREYEEFRRWFLEMEAERWDQSFEADVRSGKLDALADQALSGFNETCSNVS